MNRCCSRRFTILKGDGSSDDDGDGGDNDDGDDDDDVNKWSDCPVE